MDPGDLMRYMDTMSDPDNSDISPSSYYFVATV